MKQDVISLDSELGDAQKRYFSHGFSHFHFQISSFKLIGQHQMVGTVSIHYDGPQRPHHDPVHLGTMEYTAIAMFLTEGMLIKQKRLTRQEINRSLLSSISMHIKKSFTLTPDSELSFEISITDSSLNIKAINIGLTTLSIKIQDAQLHCVIDHPGPTQIGLPDFDLWPIQEQALHRQVYKFRQLNISNICLDQEKESISAQLSHPAAYPEQTWGVSSYSNCLSPLDSIMVSGQLMQVLLYRLLNSSRDQCPNIWLKGMEIQFDRPYHPASYKVDLQFLSRHSTMLKGSSWQTIQLESQIGNMHARYKICHEMPR